MKPVQIVVLLFATLKDLAGTGRLSLTLTEEPTTVSAVREHLVEQFPHLEANLKVALAAVNEEFAFAVDPVRAGDEVAFFPPVSGGDAAAYPEIFQLAEAPIDHDAVIQAITIPATGAVCVFSGMVRGETGREGYLPQTAILFYEAYAPMAIAKMKQVAHEIRERWPLVQGIAMIQRVGTLQVGQNTILIACSSGHRDQGCFEAARYGIDRLKEIVPVWKKEIGPEGQSWIEGDYRPSEADRASG